MCKFMPHTSVGHKAETTCAIHVKAKTQNLWSKKGCFDMLNSLWYVGYGWYLCSHISVCLYKGWPVYD